MTQEAIQKAVELGRKLQHVFVATADREGLPHITAAGGISLASDGYVAVSAWFCPGTLNNLQQNRLLSLVIWEPATDKGYQLLGEVQSVEEMAMMDGYAPELEHAPPMPQIERRLIVRVDSLVAFSHAPHTDMEE